MEKNILFEKEDIEWCVMDDTIGLSRFLEDAKKIVKEKTYTPTYAGNYGANQGYGRSPNYTPQSYSGPYNPASQTGAGSTQGAGTGGSKGNTGGKGKGGKKDKKKTKFNANTKNPPKPTITPGKNACEEQMSICDQYGEPIDMTDPFCAHEGPYFQIT